MKIVEYNEYNTIEGKCDIMTITINNKKSFRLIIILRGSPFILSNLKNLE